MVDTQGSGILEICGYFLCGTFESSHALPGARSEIALMFEWFMVLSTRGGQGVDLRRFVRNKFTRYSNSTSGFTNLILSKSSLSGPR